MHFRKFCATTVSTWCGFNCFLYGRFIFRFWFSDNPDPGNLFRGPGTCPTRLGTGQGRERGKVGFSLPLKPSTSSIHTYTYIYIYCLVSKNKKTVCKQLFMKNISKTDCICLLNNQVLWSKTLKWTDNSDRSKEVVVRLIGYLWNTLAYPKVSSPKPNLQSKSSSKK